MNVSPRLRLIIRLVLILLFIAICLLILPSVKEVASKNKSETEVQPPLVTDDVTLVFEPIEYDVPLETQEPESERENESTEISEEVEWTPIEVAATEAEKPEVTTPISETILIDFSEEEWETTYEWVVNQYNEEIQMIAKVILLEAGGVIEYDHKAAIVWTIVNRVDAGYGPTVKSVIIPGQFAYNENAMVRGDLWAMAADVLTRWTLEKQGYQNVGRVLPSDYYWYWGDGQYNWFRNIYTDGSNPWTWEYPSPYLS